MPEALDKCLEWLAWSRYTVTGKHGKFGQQLPSQCDSQTALSDVPLTGCLPVPGTLRGDTVVETMAPLKVVKTEYVCIFFVWARVYMYS